MTKGKTDLASQLLEQHVKHELASLKGAKLRKFLSRSWMRFGVTPVK